MITKIITKKHYKKITKIILLKDLDLKKIKKDGKSTL